MGHKYISHTLPSLYHYFEVLTPLSFSPYHEFSKVHPSKVNIVLVLNVNIFSGVAFRIIISPHLSLIFTLFFKKEYAVYTTVSSIILQIRTHTHTYTYLLLAATKLF